MAFDGLQEQLQSYLKDPSAQNQATLDRLSRDPSQWQRFLSIAITQEATGQMAGILLANRCSAGIQDAEARNQLRSWLLQAIPQSPRLPQRSLCKAFVCLLDTDELSTAVLLEELSQHGLALCSLLQVLTYIRTEHRHRDVVTLDSTPCLQAACSALSPGQDTDTMQLACEVIEGWCSLPYLNQGHASTIMDALTLPLFDGNGPLVNAAASGCVHVIKCCTSMQLQSLLLDWAVVQLVRFDTMLTNSGADVRASLSAVLSTLVGHTADVLIIRLLNGDQGVLQVLQLIIGLMRASWQVAVSPLMCWEFFVLDESQVSHPVWSGCMQSAMNAVFVRQAGPVEGDQDLDDWVDYRRHASSVWPHMLEVGGPELVVGLLHQAAATANDSWQSVESALFVIKCLAPEVFSPDNSSHPLAVPIVGFLQQTSAIMGRHPRLTAAFWEAITSCYRYFQNEPANLAFLLDAAAAMLTHGEMDCRRAAATAFHRLMTACAEHVFSLPNIEQLFATAIASLSTYLSILVTEALVRLLQSRPPSEQHNLLQQICHPLTSQLNQQLSQSEPNTEDVATALEAMALVFRFLPDILDSEHMAEGVAMLMDPNLSALPQALEVAPEQVACVLHRAVAAMATAPPEACHYFLSMHISTLMSIGHNDLALAMSSMADLLEPLHRNSDCLQLLLGPYQELCTVACDMLKGHGHEANVYQQFLLLHFRMLLFFPSMLESSPCFAVVMELALRALTLEPATFNTACQFLIPLLKAQQPLPSAIQWIQANSDHVVASFAGFVDGSDNIEGSSRVAMLMIQACKHSPVLVELWNQALCNRQRGDEERQENRQALQGGHISDLASCLETIKEV